MERLKTKFKSSFFLFLLLILSNVLTSCVREGTITVREEYIAAKEKEWLSKAYRVDKNGWIYLYIEGEPFERGFQRGYLTANEIDDFLETLAYILKFDTAKEVDFFGSDLVQPIERCPMFLGEVVCDPDNRDGL